MSAAPDVPDVPDAARPVLYVAGLVAAAAAVAWLVRYVGERVTETAPVVHVVNQDQDQDHDQDEEEE